MKQDIVEALIKKHVHRTDLHIIRVMGIYIAVSNGCVIDCDESAAISYCPLHTILGKGKSLKAYVEGKVTKYGYYTPDRAIVSNAVETPFGASELFMSALSSGLLDCAVVVCDGAGTVVVSNPEIVQGIGGRMNSLFHTTPIKEIQKRLQSLGCIVFSDAAINQYRGLRTAFDAGYSRIGVTINGVHGDDYEYLKQYAAEAGIQLYIFTVCTTGVDAAQAAVIMRYSDIVWGCASSAVREHASKTAVLQLSIGIPVFICSYKGLKILAASSNQYGQETLVTLEKNRQYLLSKLPEGDKIRIGSRSMNLCKRKLPVAGKHDPYPLR